MKNITWSILLLLPIFSFSQSHKTENIILITLDGMRWEEIFGGTDPVLSRNTGYTRDTAAMRKIYGGTEDTERRKKLFPFLWNTIAFHGQLYGNRNIGNLVNVANPYKFSYPGYNELLTGYPDTAINSNDKIKNPNTSVLEFLNKQKGFTGKIAAFSTWDVFPYILNTWRSGIYVNSNVDTLHFPSPQFALINSLQFLAPKPLDVRPDLITYAAAKEYLLEFSPRVLYIAFDETDDFAHGGLYDEYIRSAHAEDGMIADIWNTLQSLPQYKNKTTLIITCDHGRGNKIKDQWRDHGEKIGDSGETWMAVIGPDTAPSGEIRTQTQLYQKQWAPTIAALLGFHFIPDHGSAEPAGTVILGK